MNNLKSQDLSNKLSKEYLEASEGHVLEERLFFVDPELTTNKDLSIVWGGFERCANDFEIRRRHYPYFILEYPTKGRCRLDINGQEHLLKKNVIGGFSPSCSHHYLADDKQPMEHLFIAFTGKKAAALFERSTLLANGVIEIANLPDIDFLMQTIIKKGLAGSTYSNDLCNHYLHLLLLELSEQAPLIHETSASMNTFLECKRFIEENYSWLLSAKVVADECNISLRHLTRIFKQYGEQPPHEYITRLKMNKARVLLASSNDSVKSIASKIGYEDPYHFSRNFKKYYLVSPKQFRLNEINSA